MGLLSYSELSTCLLDLDLIHYYLNIAIWSRFGSNFIGSYCSNIPKYVTGDFCSETTGTIFPIVTDQSGAKPLSEPNPNHSSEQLIQRAIWMSSGVGSGL